MATSSSHGPRRQNAHQNILKQGYLKKCMAASNLVPSAATQLAYSIKQKLEPNRWYVFGVRNSIPFLEYYEKEESIFTSGALETYDLSTYENLSYTMGRTNTNFSFCIYLSELTIELMAPNRPQMVDWCNCLQRHLHNLGLRTRNAKGDHTYSEFPVKPKPPTRSPQPDDYLFETPTTSTSQQDTEEDQDPIYDDPQEVKTNDSNNNTASPIPPPRRRKPSEEDVFASLASVTRISAERENDYFNLKPNKENLDHPEEVTMKVDASGARVDKGSESDSDSDESAWTGGDTAGASGVDYANENCLNHLKKVSSVPLQSHMDGDDELGDKYTSLPARRSKKSEQSDTSEDSDFVSTSFWLRNKMSDQFSKGSGVGPKSKTLPPVPVETMDRPPPLPVRDASLEKLVKKMNASMDEDSSGAPSISSDDGDNTDSAADDSADEDDDIAHLGVAPQPPLPPTHKAWTVDSLYTDTVIFSPSHCKDKKSSEHEKQLVYQVTSSVDACGEDQRVNASSKMNNLIDLVDDTDDDIKLPARKMTQARHEQIEVSKQKQEMPTNFSVNNIDDNGGTYETLVRIEKPPDKSNACHIQDKNDSAEEIYEAAWQAKSKCNVESEKLRVNLPLEDDYVKPEKQCVSQNEPRTSQQRNPSSNKFKNRVSKVFSRKSHDQELPESLSVSLTNSEAGDDNFYSDMPEGNSAKNCTELDSDILRLSRAKNPIVQPQTSPVLPKRSLSGKERTVNPKSKDQAKAKTTGRQFNGSGMSKSLIDNSDSEDNDSNKPMSKSAGPGLDLNRPPSPPERYLRNNKSDLFTSSTAVPPVAPPRRNRKTVCLTTDQNGKYCMETGGSKVNNFSDMPPLPQRNPSLRKNDPGEPVIPPRDYVKFDEKRPPPPRPRMGPTRQSSLDAPGGARSKQAYQTPITNLKQNQADSLKAEIDTPGGMMLIIQKSHFQHGIAFVECFDKVWIAGWDLRRFPRLYDKFHIGDQLLSINDVICSDLAFAHKLIKNVKADSIEVTVKRLPYGRVFAIQRSAEGENLGIKREGGTAEIVYVDPHGLAVKHGLTNKCSNLDGTGYCNWFLTEINMRPLNLFFKDQEIEHRLMAVGRDISIVVQPHFFIKELKKQLKKIRGYKDFVVQ